MWKQNYSHSNAESIDKHEDLLLSNVIRAVATEQFPTALTGFLREIIPFDNFIVIAYDGEASPTVIYREFKDSVVYQAMDTDYVSAAYLLDPFFVAHLRGIRSGAYRLFDLAPDRFRHSSYFDLYYEKTTLIDEIAIFARTSSGGSITACLGTDKSSDRKFSLRAIKAVQERCNVIETLIEMNWGNSARSTPAGDEISLPVIDRLKATLLQERGIQLSSRQAEVALFVLQGHSSRSISLNLDISVHTVKIFRKQLYAKCRISSQAELFAMLLPLLSKG